MADRAWSSGSDVTMRLRPDRWSELPKPGLLLLDSVERAERLRDHVVVRKPELVLEISEK